MRFDEEYLRHARHVLAGVGKIEQDIETKFTQLYFSKSGLDPVIREFIFEHLRNDSDLYRVIYFFYLKLDTLKIGDVYDGPNLYGLDEVDLEIIVDEDKRIIRFEINK